MITTPSAKIDASSFLDPSGRFVPSAERLSLVVLEALKAGNSVEISLAGLRGVPSAYFNTVLLNIGNQLGREALVNRVSFVFSNDAQRSTYERSLGAVINSLADAAH